MTEAEIYEAVRDLMVDVFDVDDLEISASTTAADVEAWDSLTHIRLIVAIEKKFKITFKNSEVEHLKTVGDLVGLISAKVSHR
jgi:acyl carrier protein